MMNKEKALNEVKKLLTENGIEYKGGVDGDILTVEVGRIVQWFYFFESSFSVVSAVIVGKRRIETSNSNKDYKDVIGFCFINGAIWINGRGLGYTILSLKPNN